VFDLFPSSALESFHRSNPFCRLHITRFRLQSLAEGVPEPHELQLMTSPCLYSVAVYVVESRADMTYYYNWDAAFQMIERPAPRLGHVRIVNQYSRSMRRGSSQRLPRHPPSRRHPFYEIPRTQVGQRPIRSFGYNGLVTDIIPELIENSGVREL
jgi:hypothetical protein